MSDRAERDHGDDHGDENREHERHGRAGGPQPPTTGSSAGHGPASARRSCSRVRCRLPSAGETALEQLAELGEDRQILEIIGLPVAHGFAS
jgi:hypothetical protein